MIIKLKISRAQIKDFRVALLHLFDKQLSVFNYLEYYNTMNIINKVNNIYFRSNMNTTKNFTLSLDPNQGNQFLKLVSGRNDLFNQSAYYKAMFIGFCNDIHKQNSNYAVYNINNSLREQQQRIEKLNQG